DSNSTIDIANNPKLNYASKYMDISYHFTCELLEDQSISLLHILLSEKLANICMKGLPYPQHDNLCSKIFGTKVTKGVED
ncbi:hypothetical protein L873DRAFT_1712839, partial [Choiromyces venosus 120613-1]